MAKMKHFAVDIEYTVKETLYVQARRPNGAKEKALTDDAYRAAHMYDCDAEDCYCAPYSLPSGAVVTNVREV